MLAAQFFFLDEIQTVPGWEVFARRLLETERIDLFLSGSSARLLSREVATSMRGRAMEALVHPFGFREYLRYFGREPERHAEHLAQGCSLRAGERPGGRTLHAAAFRNHSAPRREIVSNCCAVTWTRLCFAM